MNMARLIKLVALLACGAAASSDLSFMKYPQDTTGKLLIDKDDDGLPNVNLNSFDNNANTCPTNLSPWGDLKLACNAGNFSSHNLGEHGKCKCGTFNNSTHAHTDCYRCGVRKVGTDLHFRGSRPDKFQCSQGLQMTRRQSLERA